MALKNEGNRKEITKKFLLRKQIRNMILLIPLGIGSLAIGLIMLCRLVGNISFSAGPIFGLLFGLFIAVCLLFTGGFSVYSSIKSYIVTKAMMKERWPYKYATVKRIDKVPSSDPDVDFEYIVTLMDNITTYELKNELGSHKLSPGDRYIVVATNSNALRLNTTSKIMWRLREKDKNYFIEDNDDFYYDEELIPIYEGEKKDNTHLYPPKNV